jgi:lipopolysaccharide export system permease protein
MLQNKIYQNYSLEILKLFITILLSLTVIAWTVRAVNFLDLIVENGYSILIYFEYSLLNLFGIIPKFIPLSFLLAITLFIVKQIQENELVILWTSGVKKIQIVNLFLFVSILITIFHLIFSVIITPYALNKSRYLLTNNNLTSILPTFRIQQFSDSFKDLTFMIDGKFENKISNIFLHDESNVLKNISSKKDDKSSSTIIAKVGVVEEKKLILFDGMIISSNKKNDNDIVKFEQIAIDLSGIKNTTIKAPKIQETSTLKLMGCANNNYYNDKNCYGNFKKEIIPTLNRRIMFPLFIPVIALISSLLLIKNKKSFFFNKISIFGYSFIVLLYTELTIRYTGIFKLFASIFILSPFVIAIIAYLFLKLKLSQESKFHA